MKTQIAPVQHNWPAAATIASFAAVLALAVLWPWDVVEPGRWLDAIVGASWRTCLSLASATLVSEDAACVAAGHLVSEKAISWWAGTTACLAGIYVGDLGLWVLGRTAGRRLLHVRWMRRRLPRREVIRLARRLDQHAAMTVFAARFTPGTRLPLYIAAGMLGRRPLRFALLMLLAAVAWTPLVVTLVAVLGPSYVQPFRLFVGSGWPALVLAAVTAMVLLRVLERAIGSADKVDLRTRLARIVRWEFWPAWVFYLPIALWIVLLSLRRGGVRGFLSITAANPGMPHGGFVGESKSQILSSLRDDDHVLPFALIPPVHRACDRVRALDALLSSGDWPFPFIMKPDAGQRGAGVRLIRSRGHAVEYLRHHCRPVLVQRYHPGPFEAGIFYVRLPSESRGRIFSITDKQFPVVTGDGAATLAELILRHPRYRLQASVFLSRHASQLTRVPGLGEHVRLSEAGNHCQGTMFRDGAHLITPSLEAAIDAVARTFDGFHFGRFDVRYSDVAAFSDGREFAIIELNGVTSESTNVYDPAFSLIRAYRIMAAQWSMLFRIADENVRRGHRPSGLIELAREITRFYRDRDRDLLSD